MKTSALCHIPIWKLLAILVQCALQRLRAQASPLHTTPRQAAYVRFPRRNRSTSHRLQMHINTAASAWRVGRPVTRPSAAGLPTSGISRRSGRAATREGDTYTSLCACLGFGCRSLLEGSLAVPVRSLAFVSVRILCGFGCCHLKCVHDRDRVIGYLAPSGSPHLSLPCC